ncbi:arginase [Xylaria bambusicola]|uniref:arginase n=1 Tax=Xylaria bambusicola TaxID=326684 RepID=UPI002008C6A2|nr:arginase [Xylaria bambusicola]KAI0517131.1 arginase [Xylaria bambusicola]
MQPKGFALFGAVLLGVSRAREWQFPQAAAAAAAQQPLGRVSDDNDDVDILYGSQFNGLNTYARVPYVNCLSNEEVANGAKYDIAILGAPFDTAVTARPGARYGPRGIRTSSQRKYADFAWSVYTGKNALKSWATVVDCGDVPLTVLDNNYALAQLTKGHKVVSGRKAANQSISSTPRIIMLGGDHTTTLPALRSVHKHWGQASVIHFDSHLDTWEPSVIGGGLSDYAGLNHGTFLHIAHEEGLIRKTSIHAGIRAPIARPKEDIQNDEHCGFARITARDLDRIGTAGIITRIRERVTGPVYISVDIDVLDPAFAPATGTPEPGGWSTRELLSILDGLAGLEVVGADVVEVAPVYDTRGETTSLAAAEVVWSLLELMVETPVKSLADQAKYPRSKDITST